jgi:hypothetical protein
MIGFEWILVCCATIWAASGSCSSRAAGVAALFMGHKRQTDSGSRILLRHRGALMTLLWALGSASASSAANHWPTPSSAVNHWSMPCSADPVKQRLW